MDQEVNKVQEVREKQKLIINVVMNVHNMRSLNEIYSFACQTQKEE